MGSKDPWLNSEGALDIELKFQYRDYYNHEPPARPPPTNCIKPVPIQVLCHIDSIVSASANEEMKAMPYMIQLV